MHKSVAVTDVILYASLLKSEFLDSFLKVKNKKSVHVLSLEDRKTTSAESFYKDTISVFHLCGFSTSF